MALALAIAAVVLLAALVLALAWFSRTRPEHEQLADDLIVTRLRPRGNARRLGGDDE